MLGAPRTSERREPRYAFGNVGRCVTHDDIGPSLRSMVEFSNNNRAGLRENYTAFDVLERPSNEDEILNAIRANAWSRPSLLLVGAGVL